MASAAPATPSAPATGSGTVDASPASQPTGEPAAPTLKPIPPKFSQHRLPGVDPDPGDDGPSIADIPSANHAPSSIPSRDPITGKFVAATPSGPDGVHTEQSNDEPVKSKVKFAGKEYADLSEAEQVHRTLEGNFKPLMGVAKQLGGVDQIVPTLSKAVESAQAWQAEANRLKAELDAARSGQPSQEPQTGNEATQDGIDWKLYEQIRELAYQNNTPWKAEEWLQKQTDKQITARTEKLLAEKFKPLEEAEAHEAMLDDAGKLWSDLGSAKTSDGQIAYPELHDEVASFQIGRLWSQLGLPKEYALTPMGAIAALAVYRMASGQAAPPATTQSVIGEDGAQATPPLTDALAAAGLADGRPTVTRMANGVGHSPEAANILAALRNVDTGSRSQLGFDR